MQFEECKVNIELSIDNPDIILTIAFAGSNSKTNIINYPLFTNYHCQNNRYSYLKTRGYHADLEEIRSFYLLTSHVHTGRL